MNKPYDDKPQPLIGVAVCVLYAYMYNDQKKLQILMSKRLKHPNKDVYACPGGKLEHGETIESCARRELFEETGLVVKNLVMPPDSEYMNSKYPYSQDFFFKQQLHYLTFYVPVIAVGKPEVKEPTKNEEWIKISTDNLKDTWMQDIYLPFGNWMAKVPLFDEWTIKNEKV